MSRFASILSLFSPCCPAHIPRLVVAVVVDAIERKVNGWTRSDVGQECSEVMAPLIAHANATAAIAMEFWIPRVLASLNSLRPRIVFGRLLPVLRSMSVPPRYGRDASGGYFFMETSTRARLARLQMATSNQPNSAAETSAAGVIGTKFVKNGQAFKCLAREICAMRHANIVQHAQPVQG